VLLTLFLVTVAQAAQPTFHRDVNPILASRCQSCHRTGEAAPMPLMTYKQVRPWAKAIREAVIANRMPPWHADSSVMKYANDLSLTETQRRVLVEWVDGGCVEGDASTAPKPADFTEGWRISRPDVTFTLPEAVRVPASGVLEYQYFVVDTGFTEDKWVEMAEVRPSARTVVHHAIVSVRAPDDHGWWGGQFLAGYAPGAAPQIWKSGVARLIPARAQLIFQMHYTTNGKAQEDRTQVGLVFARTAPRERVLAMRAVNTWFTIPPREPNHRVDAAVTVHDEMKLAAVRPHMHLRGKSFEVRAVFPDGGSRVVLRVPKYDFHWQPYYYLETPLILPAGTRLECKAVFDNSANKPGNPNADEAVRWGDQSWEEMMIGWFDVLVPAGKQRPLSSAVRQ